MPATRRVVGPWGGRACRRHCASFPGWKVEGKAIARTYGFANYFETIAFVNALAFMVHREDHHPDLSVGYNRCTVRFSTHSADGITQNDLICAAKADAIFDQRYNPE